MTVACVLIWSCFPVQFTDVFNKHLSSVLPYYESKREKHVRGHLESQAAKDLLLGHLDCQRKWCSVLAAADATKIALGNLSPNFIMSQSGQNGGD